MDWERSDGGDMGVIEIIDGVLYIRNVQPAQAGDYSCVGKSRTNDRLFSATTRLVVIGKFTQNKIAYFIDLLISN